MRKFFQHNYIVTILAYASLTLALISFIGPKIESYISSVKERQSEIGFADHSLPITAHPEYHAQILLPLSLFFSLLITKRILFSLLSAVLFILQLTILYRLYLSWVEFPMSYFINTPSYAPLFVIGVLALSYGESFIFYRLWQLVKTGGNK